MSAEPTLLNLSQKDCAHIEANVLKDFKITL